MAASPSRADQPIRYPPTLARVRIEELFLPTMAYKATVMPVMIASPGDVLEERQIAREVILEWDYIHSTASNAVLMPVGWESHSSPELGDRAQALINDRVLAQCDLLVGIFWTRLGTPTGESASGTVEEIEKHIAEGKPAMIYFSTKPVAPQSINQDQFAALTEFRKWCEGHGLVETFDNIIDFRTKFARQLQITVHRSPYLQRIAQTLSNSANVGIHSIVNKPPDDPLRRVDEELSEEAKSLLLECSIDQHGVIIKVRTLGGQIIQSNGKTFGDSTDRRSMARWEFALDQLREWRLVVATGSKGELFEITEKGYKLADHIKAPAP